MLTFGAVPVDDLEPLLARARRAKRESSPVEFKEQFDPAQDGEWLELTKDLVALANVGGGVVIVGLRNNGTFSGADVKRLLGRDPTCGDRPGTARDRETRRDRSECTSRRQLRRSHRSSRGETQGTHVRVDIGWSGGQLGCAEHEPERSFRSWPVLVYQRTAVSAHE